MNRRTTETFSYSKEARRYRNVTDGRFVSERTVRSVLDTVLDKSSERMAALSAQLRGGELSIASWQKSMQAEIKSAHLSSLSAARGGWNQLTPADFGRAGAAIKKQYAYLQKFAEQIYTGEQGRTKGLEARAKLYAQSARNTYEEERRLLHKEEGFTEEKRVKAAGDSCVGCIEEAGKGWSPIGTLAGIGTVQCKSNCRCHMEYR